MTYNQQFVAMWRIPESVLNTRDEQSLLQYTLSQVKDPAPYLARLTGFMTTGRRKPTM